MNQSKNKVKNSNTPNWSIIIDETITQSREKIRDVLIKKYRLKKDNVLRTENDIYKFTIGYMKQLYSGVDFEKNVNTITNKFVLGLKTFPEFISWAVTSMRIPYYQTLGDTMGYYNGNWEFNYGDVNAGPDYVNKMIYEFISFGGINDINLENWIASDDTILYLATFRVLSEIDIINPDIQTFGEKLKKEYLAVRPQIMDRHPGATTISSLEKQEHIKWDELQYDSSAKGNGSVMRCGCIGIFFPGKINRSKLVYLAMEASRITHNSTIANLGSVTAALFTAYGLEKISVNLWPGKLIRLLKSDLIDLYMKKEHPTEYPLYVRDKITYIGQWEKYIRIRFNGTNIRGDQKWMKNPVLRYKYLSENFSKGCQIPGGCADDCIIMAYDALLESENIFEKIVVYSILHPGDSDTVGSVALSWYGARYHTMRNEILFEDRFDNLEFSNQIYDIDEKITSKLIKTFYHDIYLSTAYNYLNNKISTKIR